jgi:hypothetical protein
MSRTAIDFDAVRKIGLALPGVEESTAFGFPARSRSAENSWHVCRRIARPNPLPLWFAWISTNRAELLGEAPDIYYVTDHYVGYSAILVRLSRVSSDVLRDLLGMAYKFVTGKVAPPSPSPKRRKLVGARNRK